MRVDGLLAVSAMDWIRLVSTKVADTMLTRLILATEITRLV
jgi:hypothetical protein